MATPANLAQLADAGLAVDAAAPSDLLVIVRGEAPACDDAIDAADSLLRAPPAQGDGGAAYVAPLTSLACGVERDPDADLALISVPGDYAAAEALKALALGLHVMLFSDNVAVEDERAIKRYARARGLLVMGPDCGTAIVNGVPLGFANVVRRGDIGLVAASGTGPSGSHLPHPSTGAAACRRRSAPADAISRKRSAASRCSRAFAALADDAQTRVIVLISKPPAPAIARAIVDAAAARASPSSSTSSANRRRSPARACTPRVRCNTPPIARSRWRRACAPATR